MDKGSNISFPLDSGSTVYNGSGISVGGKASTDILHAAGGTTKIKTLNGESMLGEGNIVIDPSSVPVSLSWYNRTSSQQDATINLTIGDTTVNLFPNIFKLFKAGKVSTSESLSIELTANPGVSGVSQVPTSLCQWSIPLADSNTAGIISSEDKAKLDNHLALSFCIYNKYLICACKVIYLLYCMGVKFYITLHCLIIS